MQESGKEVVKAIKSSENEIRNLDRRIADRRKAMDADADPEQARLRTRLEEMDNTLRRLTRDVPYKEDLIQNVSLERDQANDRLAGIDRQIDEVGGQISSTSGTLRNLEGQSSDRLSAFGTNLALVMEEIRRARWVHSPPIGPLGLYVKLEDMDYKDAFHSLLGQSLCTFAVRDPRDRTTMLSIMQRCAKR